jgi:hypothetical protein
MANSAIVSLTLPCPFSENWKQVRAKCGHSKHELSNKGKSRINKGRAQKALPFFSFPTTVGYPTWYPICDKLAYLCRASPERIRGAALVIA